MMAALCETAGQFAYVFAIGANAIVAARQSGLEAAVLPAERVLLVQDTCRACAAEYRRGPPVSSPRRTSKAPL